MSKTPLLQEQIQDALSEFGQEIEFVVDAASVDEARKKVLVSYQQVLDNIDKARRVADQTNVSEIPELVVLTIKCFGQSFTGNLHRWGDALTAHINNSTPDQFFEGIKKSVEVKKEAYLSLLTTKEDRLSLASDKILPYSIIESGALAFNLELKVVPNKMAWPDFLAFFKDLQKKSHRLRTRKSKRRLMDIYHLYSLHEVGINELWVCNSSFAAGYLRDLNYVPPFSDILKTLNFVRISKTTEEAARG